jgi:fibronectin type 3 domain-containing protein
VQFDPSATGTASGLVTIVSTSISNPVTVITVSGTGVTSAVDLSWDAPTASDDPVVGYNVYRETSGGSSFQLLNSGIDSEMTYTDGAVQPGSTYEYYVTSVDSAGVESVPSNTTIVAVP